MNIYVWRHNKTYHSHSMINEPCVRNDFYLDAIAVVVAPSREAAIKLLADRNEGWRPGDLAELDPLIYPVDQAAIVFTDVRGNIEHL